MSVIEDARDSIIPVESADADLGDEMTEVMVNLSSSSPRAAAPTGGLFAPAAASTSSCPAAAGVVALPSGATSRASCVHLSRTLFPAGGQPALTHGATAQQTGNGHPFAETVHGNFNRSDKRIMDADLEAQGK